MNWIEIIDISQIQVGDTLSLVIKIGEKPEQGIKQKVLNITENFIVVSKESQLENIIIHHVEFKKYSYYILK
jgi:hypothetical protein